MMVRRIIKKRPRTSRKDLIGVGVAAVVQNVSGEIALLRRSRRAGKGLWGVPGGRVRVGETLHEAVLREVHEELGVKATVVANLGIFEDIAPDGHWISGLYLVAKLIGTPSNKEPHFHSELRWFRPNEVPKDLMAVARECIARFNAVLASEVS